MKRIAVVLFALLATWGIVAGSVSAAGHADNESGTSSGKIGIPPGYRDWSLISVAHEEGDLNDIRAILGNKTAINAYRDNEMPFPDGTIIARIAWRYVPSDENNRVFGRKQSFVPGPAPDWYLQLMVKDSKKYGATGGWGFAQFDHEGKPAGDAKLTTCFSCHEPAKDRDFVFTHYAP